MAKLDHVVLMRLVQAQAEAADANVLWLFAGEDLPNGEWQQAVKVGVRITGDPNQHISGPGSRDLPITSLVELTFIGYCTPDRLNVDQEQGGSVDALAFLATTIAHAFGDTLLEDAGTTHRLDTTHPDIDLPVESDEQPGMAACVVTIRGRWERQSGSSRATV